MIHELWNDQKEFEDEQGRIIDSHVPSHVRFMNETNLSSVKLCHPQERNIHSSIFGGFLLKEAYELAYATANTFIGSSIYRPRTLTIGII